MTFIAWLVTCSRNWARLSSSHHGSRMTFGPADHILVEDYTESKVEKILHIDRNAKQGEFIRVERPCFDDIGRVRAMSKSFKLPADFPNLTQKLYLLRKEERDKFFNSCLAYQFALENWIAYPTISIIALASAVEAMMIDEYTSGFCEDAKKECNLKKDVMKKFRKFFENNLQYPLPKELETFLNGVYSKRSSYLHRYLLGKGQLPWIFPYRKTGREIKEDQRRLEILVNAGLIEWLRRI